MPIHQFSSLSRIDPLDLKAASRCVLQHKSPEESSMVDRHFARSPQATSVDIEHERRSQAPCHAHATTREHDTCCASPHTGNRSHADICHADAVTQAAYSPGADSSSAARARDGDEMAATDTVRTRILIRQMDCPTEETLIRSKLHMIVPAERLEFNLLQRVLTVEHPRDALDDIVAALTSLGFTPEIQPHDDTRTVPPPAHTHTARRWPLVAAGIAALLAEALTWLGAPGWTTAALAALAVLGAGLRTYHKGWIAIRHGNLNINALMSVAVTGAFALGQWPEAAMVMVLFTIAERIEAASLERARRAIERLVALAPDKASVQQADGSWRVVDARTVPTGARVRVKPGERIALDGCIVSGRSAVNQASITGESLPVDKQVGDAVYAGTLNTSGSFDYCVTFPATQSTLARIVQAVEQAQASKAPIQRFVDRFASVYTPVVLALALLVAAVPPLLGHAVWTASVYKALVLLVIACPCALVISTPVTIVSALAVAARHGILVKGGRYLEQGHRLAWLALDKTGTLTVGRPQQTDFEPCATVDAARCRQLATSLAARSDHPVSAAIAAAGAAGPQHLVVDDFGALPGRGVHGTIDGVRYWLGNRRLAETLGCRYAKLDAKLDSLERQGKTVVMLMDERRVLALFALADTLKPTSREAVAQLHRLGVRTLILSGDNPHTAQTIAAQAGIDEVRGNQLPDDKRRAIESLTGTRHAVGMVGDGINDAPALARADIGFAMGALGAGAAIETADVALMDDDLRKVAVFIRLSKATRRILTQNIVVALGLKGAFLALTLAGYGTMWMAVFADVGASLLVVGNGLRLLRR
ncbi:heavy metal translocating P-type ATPase [Mycetohabitans sp. B7]|nr:heavy metal translocating P-type ATPase [Mycetohabitans sp. B3]MCG1039301.1 heavy metal translocating P-type ATPase [Mycetohabitans sp. B7]